MTVQNDNFIFRLFLGENELRLSLYPLEDPFVFYKLYPQIENLSIVSDKRVFKRSLVKVRLITTRFTFALSVVT